MRINKHLAQGSSLSRRKADEAISQGKVSINGKIAQIGDEVSTSDTVKLDGHTISASSHLTIILNKPEGYVCSREGQGSQTIYNLLPIKFHKLNSVGRLDKNSSGLLILTTDGQLAQKLTHPSFQKQKIYEVKLDKKLLDEDMAKVQKGIRLEDGLSKLEIRKIDPNKYEVRMHEGRNRQIRRTFEALGYKVTKLHRTHFGPYKLVGDLLRAGSHKEV